MLTRQESYVKSIHTHCCVGKVNQSAERHSEPLKQDVMDTTTTSLPHFHFLNGYDKHILATLSLSQLTQYAYLCQTFTFSWQAYLCQTSTFLLQAYLCPTLTLSDKYIFATLSLSTTSISLRHFHFRRQCSVSSVKNSVMIQDRKSRLLLDWREKGGENSWLIRLVDGVNGVRDTKEN